MKPEQIREVVKITLDELLDRNLIKKESYTDVLRIVNKKLYDYFNNKGDGNGISYVMKVLSDDPYIDIIYLHYRDRKSIEFMAELLNKDVSTIKRNKKRLILKIYELLGGKQ